MLIYQLFYFNKQTTTHKGVNGSPSYRNKTHLPYASRRATKRRSPRSTAEESAEEEEEENNDDDEEEEDQEEKEEVNVQRKKKNVLDEERRGKRTESEVDRTKGRRAASASRSTVATLKVYHSGAQSVGCVRGTFGPLAESRWRR